MKPSAELFLMQAERLTSDVRRLFADQHPAVIGGALAELVAGYFAGMRPELRDKARAEFLQAMNKMIPECEREIFPDGLPAEWR